MIASIRSFPRRWMFILSWQQTCPSLDHSLVHSNQSTLLGWFGLFSLEFNQDAFCFYLVVFALMRSNLCFFWVVMRKGRIGTKCWPTIGTCDQLVISLRVWMAQSNWSNLPLTSGSEFTSSFAQIRDGDQGYSTEIGKFCGSDFPPIITSSSRSLWLRWGLLASWLK